MRQKIVVLSSAVFFFIGFTLQAMEQLVAPHPVVLIKRNLAASANALNNDLCGVHADVNHKMLLDECCNQLTIWQELIDTHGNQNWPDDVATNICSEMHVLLELIKTKLHLIVQSAQLIPVHNDDPIKHASRAKQIAALLKEEQKIQNSLHTLFNIIGDREYRLVPGMNEQAGDRLVGQQIWGQLPVSLFNTFWQGVHGQASAAPARRAAPDHFIPGPAQPLFAGIKDCIATVFDKTYCNAMVSNAQRLITNADGLLQANTAVDSFESLQVGLDQQIQWLMYDLAGRMRSYGFGRHNYIPLLVDDFAQQIGVKTVGASAIQKIAGGNFLLNHPRLLPWLISRPALFAARRLDSFVMATVQPKPSSYMARLKWWVTRGCSTIFRYCIGRTAMQQMQDFMAGAVCLANRHESDVVINFEQRKQAPQFAINNQGIPLHVYVGGTDENLVIAVKQSDNHQAIVEVNRGGNTLPPINRGLRLVPMEGSPNTLRLEGDTHPLIQIEHQEAVPASAVKPEWSKEAYRRVCQDASVAASPDKFIEAYKVACQTISAEKSHQQLANPVVKILGAPRRQVRVEPKLSVAACITAVREFRKSPINRGLCDELFYRLETHASSIQAVAQMVCRNAQSLVGRQFTNMQDNVENAGLRGVLQTSARQWQLPLHDQ